MGGKTKQSQRTKKNVRPSSSSRSAELLSNAATVEGGLVKLGSGKVLPALFPSLAAATLDQGLNPEFQMCIKKLNKKDPITKTKALQELVELVNNSNVDDVVSALGSWAHCYKLLTVDPDRKVREMAQVCQGAVVGACGRRSAPALRRLLPAWLQAQHDDHAPAAAAAQLALASTFPDSKLPEVIAFCKAEVMSYFVDNLVGNVDAVVAKKSDNPEERESQLCRLSIGSLHGLQYFALHLPAAHDDWLWEQLAPLLQSNVFWKYASNTSHQLRAAWYGATGRIVERFKGTFGEQYGLKTVRAILSAAKEPNALVASQLWTCLLLIMHNIQGWHAYLDKKELLVKRILDVLESGGWGDARHLSNMLLPLLANLPQDVLTKEFYEAFFKALYTGLEKKAIISSKSERQFWITSLSECLRYLSIQQNDFVVGVATSVHRTWIETILSTQHDSQARNNLIKYSATNMASILKYWLKQSKEENSEKYDQLVRNFWQNVGSTILTQIDKCGTDSDEITKLIDGHILLLQTFKTALTQDTKKQHSITFDDDKKSVEKPSEVTQQYDSSVIDRYKHNLEELVQKICSEYFEFADKKQVSNAVLTPLISLLNEFDSRDLFAAVGRQFEVDSVFKLYETVLRSWLAGDTMRSKPVVDIVFLMMKHLTEEEQDAMFATFNQFPAAVREWCAGAGAAHPHRLRAPVRRFLRGAPLRDTLARVCARALRAARASDCNLLLMCLAQLPNGEYLISTEAIRAIVQECSTAISAALTHYSTQLDTKHEPDQTDKRNEDSESGALEHSATLAAHLATTLHDADVGTQYLDLLHNLFYLNIVIPRGDSALSVDTWMEVRSSWQDGGAALSTDNRRLFLEKAACTIHDSLLLRPDDINIQGIEHMVSLCPHLFNVATSQEDLTDVINFTKRLFDLQQHSDNVEMFAIRHECVTSQLSCLDPNDNQAMRTIVQQSAETNIDELHKSDLYFFVKKLLFRALYLKAILLHKDASDDDDDEGNNCCDSLLSDDYLQMEFCKLVHDCMVVNSLHEGYAFWPHYNILQTSKPKLESLLCDIIASTSEHIKAKIASALSTLALKNGFHWAYASKWYEKQAMPEATKDMEKNNLAGVENVLTGYGYFHSLQASSKFSAKDDSSYQSQYIVMWRGFLAANRRVLEGELRHFAELDHRAGELDGIVDAYYKHNDTMLYELDITSAPWQQVVSNTAVVEFLCSMVSQHGWTAPAHHWDFTTITLCSLVDSLEKSKNSWSCTKVAMLSRSVLRLFNAVQKFVSGIKPESEKRQPSKHVFDLTSEWTDIFAADLHRNLFSLIMHVLEQPTPSVTSTHIQVLEALLTTTSHMDWEQVRAPHRTGAFALAVLANQAGAVLAGPAHIAYKYLAYSLIKMIAMPLVLEDATKLSVWSESCGDEEERSPPPFSFEYFRRAFSRLHGAVDAALADVLLGEESVELSPSEAGFGAALGWLLLADAMATVSQLARRDLLQHYIRIYREHKFAEALVPSCLRLLPGPALAFARDPAVSAAAPAHYTQMFLDVKPITLLEPASPADIGALACRGLYRAVCGAGCAAVRGWWGAAPVRLARALERLVGAYVAPHAVKEQLLHLQQRAAEIEDTEVVVAWSAGEATCWFRVEERELQLRVSLSRSHPLAPPRARAPAAPGAGTHWLDLYLAYQNGTVLNAVKMWTRSARARVQRSPQCYICYCRLHPQHGQLPRVACHQCSNKFHNSCLRKWFASSNKSNCPLCRATF